jgi:hypothetical protein
MTCDMQKAGGANLRPFGAANEGHRTITKCERSLMSCPAARGVEPCAYGRRWALLGLAAAQHCLLFLIAHLEITKENTHVDQTPPTWTLSPHGRGAGTSLLVPHPSRPSPAIAGQPPYARSTRAREAACLL